MVTLYDLFQVILNEYGSKWLWTHGLLGVVVVQKANVLNILYFNPEVSYSWTDGYGSCSLGLLYLTSISETLSSYLENYVLCVLAKFMAIPYC